MGVAQGAALRERIRSARSVLVELEAFQLARPAWMPFGLFRWLGEWKAQRFLSQAWSGEASDLRTRLHGIAEGCGLSIKTLCLFNALEPLLSNVAGCTDCPGACSAVAVRGRRSATGEPMVARNFDYLPLIQPLYSMRDCRPDGKLRSLEFTTVPLVGAVDGLNEAGLCITYDYAFTTDTPPRPAPTISMLITIALGRCTTVTQAADWISSQSRWGGGLLMLADAAGDIASLELSSTRSQLRRPCDDGDVLFHTNAFSTDALRAVQAPAEAVYTDKAPAPLRGRRLHLSSETRDARFHELLNRGELLGANELASLMADHGAEGIPGDYTPCVHGSYWHTTACLQFFPKSRRVRVAFDTACQAHYSDFQL